jgi:glutathionyl-hydroquinone reductase
MTKLILLFVLIDLIGAAIMVAPEMPVYAGGFANGTIHYKPACTTLVNQLLDMYNERPLKDGHFQIIQQRTEACNEAH